MGGDTIFLHWAPNCLVLALRMSYIDVSLLLRLFVWKFMIAVSTIVNHIVSDLTNSCSFLLKRNASNKVPKRVFFNLNIIIIKILCSETSPYPVSPNQHSFCTLLHTFKKIQMTEDLFHDGSFSLCFFHLVLKLGLGDLSCEYILCWVALSKSLLCHSLLA